MTDEEKRKALEELGEKRVRHLLSQSMMVHHLIVPAYGWLDELDAKREKEKAQPDQ